MRKTAAVTVIFASVVALASYAYESSAQAVPPTEPAPAVTIQDLQDAGFTNPQPVAPSESRFAAPTRYFRVAEELDGGRAKKDCPDCANLVGVYVAVSDSIPGWSINQRERLREIGGRWQTRTYLRGSKTIVIVTGTEKERTNKLTDNLIAKLTK